MNKPDSRAATGFSYSRASFEELVDTALAHARKLGATDAGAEASEGCGLSVSVRKGELENVERNRDKSLGVTVYVGQRRGNASTSDFSRAAIEQTVQAAYDIARFTAEDPVAGLPDAERHRRPRRAARPGPVPSLGHRQRAGRPRWRWSARRAAFATDKRITNSEGAGVSAQQSHFFSAHTRGFRGGYASSRHSISVAPIAGKGNDMQRDAWYSSMRAAAELAGAEAVGRYAAERALARLKSRKIATRECPVLFESPLAAGLLGGFVQAVSGGALYRKSTFLLDSLGKKVFAGPHRHGGRPARAARQGQRRLRRRGRAHQGAQGGRRGRGGRLLPQQLLGAQAGHEDHRQRGRLAQPDADLAPDAARRRPGRDAAQAGHGPVRDRADGPGRQLRHRRLFARRQRLLGGERRDRLSRCRRSPSPAT